jgi:hypothetical protein
VVKKGQTCPRNTRKVAKRNSLKEKHSRLPRLPALWGTWIVPALFQSKCWDDGKANRPQAQISGSRAAFFRQRVEAACIATQSIAARTTRSTLKNPSCPLVFICGLKNFQKSVDTLLRVLIKRWFFSRISSGYGVAGGTTE